ncbi:MAG: substrate-binding domain-containing protein [Candidatus Hinthialibacter antarcticus]|nr:substrate-binding domain-containing protein [Candidatus Hinthialibacter antarcticus]
MAEGDAIEFYCAAGMKVPVELIREAYEKEYGVPIQIQYGGSGTLLSNIKIANRGDLYLAADQSYIDIAKQDGLLQETIPIANITPIIAVKKGNPKNIHSIEDLLRDDVSYSLANPDAASVGRTCKNLLEASGDWAQIESGAKVMKPTVNDVANDVKLGAVDAGLVWDAVAAQYPELERVHVDELDRGEMTITIGVLSSTQMPTDALRFARYLTAKDKGLTIFNKHGYRAVEGDAWAVKPEIVFFSGTVNKPAIDETINKFAEREGVEVDTVYNGCGILVAQMKAGQRPDAYFACDVSFVKQVGDLFLDFTKLAKTDIVIAVQKGNPKNIQSLNDLTNEGVSIGVCNEEQSALGYLTMRLLKDAGVYEGVRKNVKSEVPVGPFLVNQTETGSLDACIVYEVNAHPAKDKLDIIKIDHPLANATQPYAVADYSGHKYLLSRLLDSIRAHHQNFENVGFEWLGGSTDNQEEDEWTKDKVKTLTGQEM